MACGNIVQFCVKALWWELRNILHVLGREIRGVNNVPNYGNGHKREEDDQSGPPQFFLPVCLFEIFKHPDADEKSGNSSSQMGSVADLKINF